MRSPWPAEVTPYEEGCVAVHALPGVFVCSSCLTDEEREQLTVARLELQQDKSIPF